MSKILSSFLLLLLCTFANALYFHIGETERKCFIEEIPDETMVVGNYKVEMFDKQQNLYVPTIAGLGMHVEVRDPDDNVVMSRVYDMNIGDYVHTAPGSLGMHVQVRDPFGSTVMSRTYAAEGRFTFTSHSAGEHVICLHSNSSAWFGGGQLRVHLDIQVGEHANDYQTIAAKDKLTELQLRVRQLLDQVEQITKEQNYQRRVHFRLDREEDRKMVNDFVHEHKMSKLQAEVQKVLNSVRGIERNSRNSKYREERFRQTSESTNQRVLWWSIGQTVILLLTGFWQMRHLKSFFEAKKLV